MLSNNKLLQLIKKIALKYFHKSFNGYAKYDYNFDITGGSYLLDKNLIEINPKMLTTYGNPIFIGTIKHELCHYFLVQKGYKDTRKAHGHIFMNLLRKVNGTRWAPNPKVPQWIYQCNQCGKVFFLSKPINSINPYICTKCNGLLHLVYINQEAQQQNANLKHYTKMFNLLA